MKKMYRQWLGIAALLCHITMQAAGNKAVVTGTTRVRDKFCSKERELV